jgi:DNA-binding NarL/FixJ family response regulator
MNNLCPHKVPASQDPSFQQGSLAKLTRREREVLVLLSKGRMDKEIAQAMGISIWTVHGNIKNIFKRLQVHNRTEAVIQYLQTSLMLARGACGANRTACPLIMGDGGSGLLV